MNKVKFEDVIELETLTIQDCINMYNILHMSALIEDGRIVDLVQE